jgi:hypothetical protein
MIQHAQQSLPRGNLDTTWDEILIAFELQRRFDLRAVLPHPLFSHGQSSSHEKLLLSAVAQWGRRKDQDRDRILVAIRRLEEIVIGQEATQHAAHLELLTTQEFLKFGERWNAYVGQLPYLEKELAFPLLAWKTMFWEQWRSRRVVRWQAWIASQRAEQLQNLLKWNLPTTFPSMQLNLGSELASAVDRVPIVERFKLLAPLSYVPNSQVDAIVRTTVIPSNMYGGGTIVESHFQQRAEMFRATMLLLALADFHREHGRFPESLSELAPTYFAEVPRDPQTAGTGPFVYFPHGISEDVTIGYENQGMTELMLRKNVPFLWTSSHRRDIKVRTLANGSCEIVDVRGKVVPLSEAFRASNVWLLESGDGESK